jgi:hypothetical protein
LFSANRGQLRRCWQPIGSSVTDHLKLTSIRVEFDRVHLMVIWVFTIFSQPFYIILKYLHYFAANWDCVSVIVKTGGDLRQEQLAVQLIQEFQRIWEEENCSCWIR